MDAVKKRTVPKVSLMLVLWAVLCASSGHGELIDRVVAFVDDKAITLSELNETYEKTKQMQPDISRNEVLTTMINRLLILNEARRLKMEAKTDDELVDQYTELKVKAMIRIREEEIEDFYKKNMNEFQGADYEAVKDKIEEYLTEKEINRLLKKTIAELRVKAYVKILLTESSP